MRNVTLIITLILSSLSLNAQNQVYNLKEFYNFEVFSGLNPLVEYIENRETKLMGVTSDVTIEFNEDDSVVIVKNNYSNTVDSYPIVEKYSAVLGATRYSVLSKKGEFIYVVTKQPDGNVNVYSFWVDGFMTKGWASVASK